MTDKVLFVRGMAVGRSPGGEARTGLLRALRPFHHEPERHRQRTLRLPGRRGADQAGGIRRFPDRAMDRPSAFVVPLMRALATSSTRTSSLNITSNTFAGSLFKLPNPAFAGIAEPSFIRMNNPGTRDEYRPWERETLRHFPASANDGCGRFTDGGERNTAPLLSYRRGKVVTGVRNRRCQFKGLYP